MELEGNSNAETSAAFLRSATVGRMRHAEPLTVIWDNSPAHRGDALRTYLTTPVWNLLLVNLPSYSPDFKPRFLTNRAIWGWVRQEATANVCLGTGAAVREKVRGFFAHLDHRRQEVKRRCRTILQARAAELTGSTRADLPSHVNVDFTLASV